MKHIAYGLKKCTNLYYTSLFLSLFGVFENLLIPSRFFERKIFCLAPGKVTRFEPNVVFALRQQDILTCDRIPVSDGHLGSV